jgi:2-alkyl-3-oxoalkanoate reductase
MMAAPKAAGTARQRVFLTGATGAMGLPIARALVDAGHEVVGVARSTEGAAILEALGARPVSVDLFDPETVRKATEGTDVLAHFATSIPQGMAMAKRSAWVMNDRLRAEGTRNLVMAAEANGIRRMIFESIALAYPDGGEEWTDERVPLAPLAPFMRTALEAEAMLEAFGRRGGEPVSLRFSRIYGPGRASHLFLEAVARRQMPIIGAGENFVSSIHTDDVGTSVVAALGAPPGVYNVSDDEPLRQREYLDHAARALGAPAPRRLPYPPARVLLRGMARVAAASHRVSNRRFREVTRWTPRYASVREGWPEVMSEGQPTGQVAR